MDLERPLIRNAARCLRCGDEIESRHRHDFRCCSCGEVCVDGGLTYVRRLYKTPEGVGWIELSDFVDDK